MAESLRLFAGAVSRYTREVSEVPYRDWNDAVADLFGAFRGPAAPVVIDEFPFLTRASPALPSIIQRELGPGAADGAAARA
jgi:hypothetical protein